MGWPWGWRWPSRRDAAVAHICDPGPAERTYAAAFGERFVTRACRLGCGAGTESVHHIAFDCASPAMRPCRRATIIELRLRVVALVAATTARAGIGGVARAPADEAAAMADFVAGGDLPADEAAFLGYRFLLAAP